MICSRTLILGMSVVLIAVLLLDIEKEKEGDFSSFQEEEMFEHFTFLRYEE